MLTGMIALGATFVIPFAAFLIHGARHTSVINGNDTRHMNERIEQQGFGAAVTTLPVVEKTEVVRKRAA
jgi:hypothetical protein